MQSLVNFDASRLPEDLRDRHAAYLAAAQLPDGGFPGRRGASDLYYTGFALRGLAMLGELTDAIAGRAARFLQERIDRPMPGADFFSLVTSSLLVELATGVDPFAQSGRDRRQAVVDTFGLLRREDGGYAKTPRGASSTYQTFLVVLCKQLVGAEPDDREPIARLIRSRQRPDGGFVEVDALGDGGTNPTAAAVELLLALGSLDEPARAAAVGFLAAMQTGEGGLRANTRIPVADLLSTFTGLFALADLAALSTIRGEAARRYTLSLEQPSGGFCAGAWETTADVEYTFYGLGTLALLNEVA